MLSLFDSIYLFPCILLSRAESPDLSLALKLEWIFNTSYDGLVATLSSIPGHILALGQDAFGRLPDLVSTLGSASGFIMALGQGAPGCIPTGRFRFRHWALSLASLWHWDKERLVAFQRD